MLRTLLLVSLPAALTIGLAPQASANPKENCVYASDSYRDGTQTCGCPAIKNKVITIPLLSCDPEGRWSVDVKGCGTVELNDAANTLRLYIKLRKASKC